MSRRREIEARLALYGDLAGIMGAMRSFALTELHRVTRHEAAQGEVLATLAATLGDMAPALPPQPTAGGDVWLLFGSVRGFCGSFNEDVLDAWLTGGATASPVVVVGERLGSSMADAPSRFVVAGPLGALDAAAAVDRILLAVDQARRLVSGNAGLMVCFRGETSAQVERILPIEVATPSRAAPIPVTQEPPGRVATQVMQHYLFHLLLARLLNAIRMENHMRLMQMENALRHLDHGCEHLRRQRNRLRQEEIVEEIELIVQAKSGA
jgi:F-type H+-transporting ATPase subunit gamma